MDADLNPFSPTDLSQQIEIERIPATAIPPGSAFSPGQLRALVIQLGGALDFVRQCARADHPRYRFTPHLRFQEPFPLWSMFDERRHSDQGIRRAGIGGPVQHPVQRARVEAGQQCRGIDRLLRRLRRRGSCLVQRRVKLVEPRIAVPRRGFRGRRLGRACDAFPL